MNSDDGDGGENATQNAPQTEPKPQPEPQPEPKPKTGLNEGPKLPEPLASLPTDDTGQGAQQTDRALSDAETTAPKTEPKDPKRGHPAWREPLRNFQTDENGKIKTDALGRWKRKGGRPAKPRVGDRLADGSTYGDQSGQATAGIHLPGGSSAASDDRGRVGKEQGPEMGQVIARILPQSMAAAFGKRWEASADEQKFMADSLGEATDGRRFPWALVVAIALGAYFVPRMFAAAQDRSQRIQEQQQQQKASDEQAYSDHRHDRKRQNPAGPATGPRSKVTIA
jgi:hypothetical protein